MTEKKWCSYCGKDSHNDSECHCTRPADWKPGRVMPDPLEALGRLIADRYAPQPWARHGGGSGG
jgi:hypothetical protein